MNLSIIVSEPCNRGEKRFQYVQVGMKVTEMCFRKAQRTVPTVAGTSLEEVAVVRCFLLFNTCKDI